MKRWLGLTAAGLAVVALVALPPRDLGVRPWNERDAQQRLSRQLSAELRGLDQSLRVVRVQDSLRAVIAAREDAATGIAIDHPPAFDVMRRLDVVESGLRRDVEALPARDPEVLLGAFTVHAAQGLRPEAAGWASGYAQMEWYAGRLDDGRSYCLVTITANPDYPRHPYGFDLPAEGSRLGPCAHWARFGPPGPSVERWLADGAASFTVGRSLLPSTERGLEATGTRPFGTVRLESYGWMMPRLERCLAGSVETCEEAFLQQADPLADPPPTWGSASSDASRRALRAAGSLGDLRGRWWGRQLGAVDPVLMHDLEEEFGAEAVRAFWTSEERVDHAFRSAFGMDPGTWTHAWVKRYYSEYETAGQSMPRAVNAFSVLLLLGLVAGVGGVAARRRQVA